VKHSPVNFHDGINFAIDLSDEIMILAMTNFFLFSFYVISRLILRAEIAHSIYRRAGRLEFDSR
jgi:hypothetical protein